MFVPSASKGRIEDFYTLGAQIGQPGNFGVARRCVDKDGVTWAVKVAAAPCLWVQLVSWLLALAICGFILSARAMMKPTRKETEESFIQSFLCMGPFRPNRHKEQTSRTESLDLLFNGFIVKSDVLLSSYFARDDTPDRSRPAQIVDKSKLSGSAGGALQLRREIDVMRKLEHPHIIRFREVFETDERLYVVMELCTGGEMFERIERKGRYSEADAARVLRQIFSALEHMHRHRVAHCDLKPDNFLYGYPGEDAPIKVIDFGLSKFVRNRKFFTRFCGTPYYIAPEVLDGSYAESCDIWSMGVVAFVMLYGYPPFYADPKRFGKRADHEVYRKIRRGFEPVVKAGYGAHFPLALDRVSASAKDFVAKLLVLDPAKRPTAEEALNHPWLKGDTADSSPLDPLVLVGLRSFDSQQRLKRAVLSVMVDLLTQEEVESLRRTFAALDADGSGSISVAELRAALARELPAPARTPAPAAAPPSPRAGPPATAAAPAAASPSKLTTAALKDVLAGALRTASSVAKAAYRPAAAARANLFGADDGKRSAEEERAVQEEVERVVRAVDTDGDGSISYEELLASFVHRKLGASEDRLWRAFQRMDLDGDGRLTHAELERVLADRQVPLSGDELAAMIAEADRDQSGAIDYEEFLACMWTSYSRAERDDEPLDAEELADRAPPAQRRPSHAR